MKLDEASGEKPSRMRLPQFTPREKMTVDPIIQSNGKLNKSIQLRKKRKNEKENEFDEELIRPCLCDCTWHRSCIREMIVKTELTACPICCFQYTIGYTDCLAIFNKLRPNYLSYMLWQEIIFFGCLWLFCIATLLLSIWHYKHNNVYMN